MRLNTSQQLRLEQKMKLSPRIIQAMEILQLPMMALQERIEAEMQSNPVLDLLDPEVDLQAPQAPEETDTERGERDMVLDNTGAGEDFERLAQFEDEYDLESVQSDAPARTRPADPAVRDRKMDAMANAPAPDQSLHDYLLGQWAFVDAAAQIKRAGSIIIEAIEEDGYLRTELEKLAQHAPPAVAIQAMRDALKMVQMLEPPGIGARDLSECLALQLQSESQAGRDVTLELELVSQFLRDIEMNRLPHIARKTGQTVERIKQAIDNLSHLNPRPGLLVGSRSAPIIVPDVIVGVDDDGHVVVAIPDENSPHLAISGTYRKMASDRRTDKNARRFIQNNIRSAQWLIGAIQQRQHTLRRVVEEIFKVQREFLDGGPEVLKPLPMADVARKVGIHVATVSRAVAGKYAQTPGGIFPLRMFFSGGKTTAEGQDVAWDAIKAKLKEVVDAEDKASPMNDDELVAELVKAGITIARRTVAKYRDLLGIAPARKRKQY